MQSLKLISRLLDYPNEVIFSAKQEVLEMVKIDTSLSDTSKQGITSFINQRTGKDILDWQADYDGLFERGRSLSLLIYEHIHGESRDRGQAMVDLLNQYKAAGLEIGVRELPDYLPLFLEFVSTQGDENAKGWLQDISPILATLAVRLQKRESDYATLFLALIQISDTNIDLGDIAQQLKDEKRDDTNKAIDKVWEEEAITFGGDGLNGGCPTQVNRPGESQRRDQDVPITFTDAASVH